MQSADKQRKRRLRSAKSVAKASSNNTDVRQRLNRWIRKIYKQFQLLLALALTYLVLRKAMIVQTLRPGEIFISMYDIRFHLLLSSALAHLRKNEERKKKKRKKLKTGALIYISFSQNMTYNFIFFSPLNYPISEKKKQEKKKKEKQ